MNGLSVALSNALSGLNLTQSQTAVVSRNVTRASEEDYTRKILGTTTDQLGNARAGNIARMVEKRLTDAVGTSTAGAEGQRVISEAMTLLSETIGDVEKDGSVSWGIGQLQIALQEYEASPGSLMAAKQAIKAASDLATSLNTASESVVRVRQEADSGIGSSVANANRILKEIEDLNSRITVGGNSSEEINELLDKRDAAIRKLSAEFGVRVVERPMRGVAIYTESGVTLFDVRARNISFTESPSLAPNATGNAVYIDGVQVTGAGAPMPIKTGRIAAQAEIRDKLAPTYQTQLDEVARVLISQFSESDQTPLGGSPDATGLFSYDGSPAVPLAGPIPGIASQISVGTQFSVTPTLLRDGGANGAAYVYNTGGVEGFQDRLSELISGLDNSASFSASAELAASTTLANFASLSASWVEQKRADSQNGWEKAEATLQRATDAFLKKSGVNIDEEMATLLNLEKSYQAAAKIVTTVDQMLATLMQVVR